MATAKHEVVSVVTLAGEFVGKFVNQTDGGLLELKDPRMLVQGPDGNMGFAQGICSTGKMEPDSVTMSVVFFTPSSPEVEKAYLEFTSGIQLVGV
jgi:hypothetical protein|tara:strand:+ start:133 stop:417 length:285 start_codon:yes stop_codon:yes gene_type:complete